MQTLSKSIPPNLIALSVLVVMPPFGCERKSFAVEVAHGYSGYVHIFCGASVGFPNQPVRVNSLGGADAESCPGSDAKVKVLRDGKAVAIHSVTWERNSDGSPIALSFEVR